MFEELKFKEFKFGGSFQVTRRVSNVTKSLLNSDDGELGDHDLGDGWILQLQIEEDDAGDSDKKWFELYLAAPKRVWGSKVAHKAELYDTDGCRFGVSDVEKVYTEEFHQWGNSVVSIEELQKNLKDDSFILVLTVQQIGAVAPRVDPSRPQLSFSASQAINRSFTYPFYHMDIKFLNYDTKPDKNSKSLVLESFSCGRILANRTTYFSSHAAFSEGADMTAFDAMPKFEDSYDYLSDSDLESVEAVGDDPMSGEDSPVQITKPICDGVEEHFTDPKKCKVIAIGDIAHKTWLATLGFLYTDAIAFASLSSKKEENTYIEGQAELAFPAASCKSVFRVADKLGIKDLEDHAFFCLKSQIDDENIVPEIFSSFTARYDRVKNMEFDYLIANWEKLQNSETLKQMLDEVIGGNRPQSTWLFHRIFQKLRV